MNAKKILALALAALMLLSLAACGQSTEPAATEAPAEPTEAPVEATEAPAEDTSVTVTDMTGREITLEEPATRIVALKDGTVAYQGTPEEIMTDQVLTDVFDTPVQVIKTEDGPLASYF